MQSDVLAIGAPSRGAADGSFIDLVSLTVDGTTGDVVTATQSVYSQYATLGLTLSLSSDATYLAAYYTADQLVVFHPVLSPARASMEYDTATDSDLLVLYPSAFYADSIQLSLPYLLVSGVMADSGAAVVPTLLVYEGTGWPSTVTAWTLTSTLSLSAAVAGLSFGYPARLLPVAASVLADSTAVTAVGCPPQQTVYVTHTSSTSIGALQNDPSASGLNNFGASVAVSADGETVFVLATEGMLVFSAASLLKSNTSAAVNAVELAESILPNRQQHAELTYSSYSSLAVTSNVTLVLPSTASEPLLIPFVSSSLAFDSAHNDFVPCPAGSYRSLNAPTSLSPCLFCPVGTYSSAHGSTSCTNCTEEEYCPAGSTHPYTTDTITESPESTIPEFETESFEESFEDLLINGIFSPTTVPMIIAFIIAGVTLIAVFLYVVIVKSRQYVLKVLKLYRFALMPNEEEEREKELEVKTLLDELLDEREQHAPRCPHAVVPAGHNRQPSAPGGAVAHHGEHHSAAAASLERRGSTRSPEGELATARRHEEQRVIEDTKMQVRP